MKKIILAIAILLVAAPATFAQKITKGYYTITAKGDIYYGSTKLGFITKDSLVKNAKGKKIAFLKPDGTLVDVNGKNLGKLGKDGTTYYDNNGVAVFTIKNNTDSETCSIFDANGKKIGNVHDNYKGVACSLHCFTNKMDMKAHKKIK